MLDRESLRRLWPRAPEALIDGVMASAYHVLREQQISTPLRLAHFFAQISHESGGGTVTRESLRYTTLERLLLIFGKGHHSAAITREEAPGFLRSPEALAERVYGLKNPGGKWRELGNTEPGDGYRYAGAGLLQITGRASYRAIGKLCGLDLEGRPDLAYDPAHALEVAAAEFVKLGCLPACDDDDIRSVTRKVNGGYNGLEERRAWLAKWKPVVADGRVAGPQVIAPDPAPKPIPKIPGAPAPVPPPAKPVQKPAPAPTIQPRHGIAAGLLAVAMAVVTWGRDHPAFVLCAVALVGAALFLIFRRKTP